LFILPISLGLIVLQAIPQPGMSKALTELQASKETDLRGSPHREGACCHLLGSYSCSEVGGSSRRLTDLSRNGNTTRPVGDRVWWYTPVVPATWEAEVGGSWSKVEPG
jgi:hypothetical protein